MHADKNLSSPCISAGSYIRNPVGYSHGVYFCGR